MTDAIVRVLPLVGSPWPTLDPFLFCVHHDDAYPAGNAAMGPAASLAGRELGSDFAGKDGWRMYHGDVVPGFPQHPHRGFETVTIARSGFIDHSDSLGATARFGQGDVQWLTAGKGISHCEMFPLIHEDKPNPAELFQIWLNLPRASKMVDPHFTMLWADKIPKLVANGAEITVSAGAIDGITPLAPPPHSWAADPAHDVAIWTIRLAPNSTWTMPAARAGTNRVVYFFRGTSATIAGRAFAKHIGVQLDPTQTVALASGPDEVEMLVLQGKPIGEPVAQHGPFVMTTPQEIRQAFADYQSTRFGGWPWPSDDPVHSRETGRFARHADGRVERIS